MRTDGAGIDVGASEIWVDVGIENDADPVKRFQYIHGRSESDGEMASAMWSAERGDGIDRGVLDSSVPNPGGSPVECRASQRGSRQECKRAQERYFGLPVVANTATAMDC